MALISEALARRIFLFSVAFLIAVIFLAYGIAIQRYKIWPYETLESVVDVVKSLVEFGEVVPEGRRVPAPEGASREQFTIHKPGRISSGYYVFAGWDRESMLYAAWLYDASGKRLHTWLIDYYALDPDGPLNGETSTAQPFYMLPDGSIIVSWDGGDIMTRLDACAEPLWIKNGIYHHSLTRAEDGSFWIWRGISTAYGHYNYMHNFDADTGEEIRELGLIEDVIEIMGPTSLVFGVRPEHPFEEMDKNPTDRLSFLTPDIFHPNDIDVLSMDLAPMFPMFEAGDLLLSFRTLDLIAVLDPDDRQLKWWSHGPWIGQHDPDFTVDGKISVYANNTGRGRSEIIKMDPTTNEFSNELLGGEVNFFSNFMGKHQYLPNGNIVIVVPSEGRVLEVTSDGDIVMEFNNISPVSIDDNQHIFNAMWVPSDYFETIPHCAEST